MSHCPSKSCFWLWADVFCRDDRRALLILIINGISDNVSLHQVAEIGKRLTACRQHVTSAHSQGEDVTSVPSQCLLVLPWEPAAEEERNDVHKEAGSCSSHCVKLRPNTRGEATGCRKADSATSETNDLPGSRRRARGPDEDAPKSGGCNRLRFVDSLRSRWKPPGTDETLRTIYGLSVSERSGSPASDGWGERKRKRKRISCRAEDGAECTERITIEG